MTNGALRLHLASAATALLCWLPLLLLEANAPFDLPYFTASPVLRALLGLSALVALGAAAATALLSSLIVVVLSFGRPGRAAPCAAMVPVLLTALVVVGCGTVNIWTVNAGVSEATGLLVLFLTAGGLTLAVTFVLGRLLATSGSAAMLPLAVAVAMSFGASVAVELGLETFDRRMLIVALAVLGLVLQQARVAALIADPAPRASRGVLVWGAGVIAPVAVTLLAPLWAKTAVPTSAHVSPNGPNVIIVMIDTLRADSTSLSSGDPEATPNLLALSREGTTYFSRAIAAGASTAPSVKSFFTGRSPSHWGLDASNGAPPADAWRFVHSFKAAGYQTASISANPLLERTPYADGFDYFWSAGGYRFWQRSFLLNVLYSGKRVWQVFERIEQLDLDKIGGGTVRKLASRWLDDRSPEVPFLLYLHFFEPHWPYYDRGYFEPSPRPEYGFSYVDYLRLNHGDPALVRLRNGRNVRYLRHVYREEVRQMDEELGLLIRDFERRGLLEDSILVILGDHGEEFLEHNGFSHGHDVYEEQVHVPLLVHWPRAGEFTEMPARVEGPVSLLDVGPTLIDLLDLPGAPSDLDGRSFAPALLGAAGRISDAPPVTSEASLLGRSFFAYREGDLKARVQYEAEVPAWESDDLAVVDLARDPGEQFELDRTEEEVSSFLVRARAFLRENRRQSR
jgi:arylsulfatase A-like enzyme